MPLTKQRMNKMKIKWKILILSLVIVYLVAFIGSIFTSQNTGTEWYESIKPSMTPPNYVFPVVWNILFFLIALSLYVVIINSKRKQKKIIYAVFGINFFLNILWSFLFFYLQNPMLAFYEIFILWLSIMSMILVTWKINKVSSVLLWPYLLWVSFASYLNYLIVFP